MNKVKNNSYDPEAAVAATRNILRQKYGLDEVVLTQDELRLIDEENRTIADASRD